MTDRMLYNQWFFEKWCEQIFFDYQRQTPYWWYRSQLSDYQVWPFIPLSY